MSNVDSIPSPNGVFILRCEYQSFMVIEIVMSILFHRCVSLQVDPIISTSASSTQVFSTAFVSSISKLSFFFPPCLPFCFFEDPDFFIGYPFNSCEVTPFFFVNILTRWFSRRCSTSSPFLSLLRWIQVKFCWSYLFPHFNVFSYRCSSYSFTSRYLLFRSAQDISKIRAYTLLSFKLFRGCSLIQVFYFNRCIIISFKSFQRCSFEWALTHRSFPRILPDSSIFPKLSQILLQVWRKNELSSVKCFFSKIFQILFIVGSTSSLLILPVCLNNSWWCFSLSFSSFEDRRRVSL